MRFCVRFPNIALPHRIRRISLPGFLVSAALLLFNTDLSSQTWQRVIDYAPDFFGDYYSSSEIFATDDGGFLVVLPDGFLVKLDADGDTLWTRLSLDSSSIVTDVKRAPDGTVHLMAKDFSAFNRLLTLNNAGEIVAELAIASSYDDFCATGDGFVLLMDNDAPGDSTLNLLRINLAGDTVWALEYVNAFEFWYAYDIIQTIDGGFVASLFELHPNASKRQFLIKTDADGAVLWTSNAPTIEYANPDIGQLFEEPDGSIVLIGTSSAFYAIRLSASGEVLLENSNFTFHAARDLMPTPDGGFWAVGWESVGGVNKLYIRKLRHDFTVEWKRLYGPSVFGTSGFSIVPAGGGSCAILGQLITGPIFFLNAQPLVIRTDSLGNVQENLISGQLRHDLNEDCIAESAEPALANWLVSTGVYYTLTDSFGKFEVYGGIGSTPVNIYPPLAYWVVCPGFDTVTFTQAGDTAYLEIPAYAAADCPFTEINVSTWALRPCFESIFSVQYCNLGTVAADSASAMIVLPPEIDFISASIPVSQQSGDSLWFDLGVLDVGECGDFSLTVILDCDSAILGQTLCVEARIFPDTICFPITNWSGAEVKVTAQCIDDQEVKLTIRNIGSAPTTPTLQYLIIEDQVVLHQGPFELNPDSILEFTELANGSFWRISAEQEPNFPTPSAPAAWVEGCGGFQSTGYVNGYYFDDAASSVDLECRVVTGSYDPNDKQAFPEGYGDEHYIEPGTELTYLIRFQNTGTDTAFNVILRDTLDVWFEPASVRPGASSHPYEFDIVGPGVLKIWFKNILLPDSNVNEAASHGFFQYRVKMKPGIPLETIVRNRAAIYFDFNAPVITNETFHTVGKNFYTVSVSDVAGKAGARLTVAPNPFRETTRMMIENALPGGFDLRIFDVNGRQLRKENFDGPEILFQRKNLPPGLYFFEVRQRGSVMFTGKMTAL